MTIVLCVEGASLDATGMVREEDETLCWQEVPFIRSPNGIGVKISFRFSKGNRKLQLTDGIRTFAFPPSTRDQHELVAGLVFLSIALSMGIFEFSTAEGPFDGEDIYFPITAAMQKDPVLVKVSRSSLELKKPMR